jgi:hypothetical protein
MDANSKRFYQAIGRGVKQLFFQWAAPVQAKVDQTVISVRQLERTNQSLAERVATLENRPTKEYRGVWREGSYQRGDEVTHDGSRWIALADTATRPGTPNSQWQLSVKRGRNGKDGRDGMTRDEIEVLVRRIVREELTDTEVAA